MDPYNNFLDFVKLMHTHSYGLTGQGNAYPMTSGSDIYCTPCPPPCTKAGWPRQKANKEEVTPMASYASATVVTAENIEAGQRQHVRDRLYNIEYKLKTDLRKQFGLEDDERPTTPEEFIKRITEGKYTIDEKHLDQVSYSPAEYIRWRDPSTVEDKAGYKAAKEKLAAAYEDAKTAAVLAPVTDLQKVIDDFKSFTA